MHSRGSSARKGGFLFFLFRYLWDACYLWDVSYLIGSLKKLFSFWIDNLIKPSWSAWINHPPRKEHGLNNLDWWIDQDFLNCLDINDTPFPLKKVDAGYEFNYYTSTWGFFNDQISMISKIGNKNFPIIHFKADFRKAFNLENSSVYNIENILSSNTSATSSLDVTAKAEKELDNMIKYQDRLELMQNYFLVTGSSE